jgi:hypothetical protein
MGGAKSSLCLWAFLHGYVCMVSFLFLMFLLLFNCLCVLSQPPLPFALAHLIIAHLSRSEPRCNIRNTAEAATTPTTVARRNGWVLAL